MTFLFSRNGSEPQLGSSGSPILEAFVIPGKDPKWNFRSVAALYGRCPKAWWDRSKDSQSMTDAKMICAIPIKQDFDQILRILHGEEIGKRNEKFDSQVAQRFQNQARLELREFQQGMSILNMSVPEGLEKLLKSNNDCDISPLSESLFIKENIQKLPLQKKENILRQY